MLKQERLYLFMWINTLWAAIQMFYFSDILNQDIIIIIIFLASNCF